jgi:hypothetical protein
MIIGPEQVTGNPFQERTDMSDIFAFLLCLGSLGVCWKLLCHKQRRRDAWLYVPGLGWGRRVFTAKRGVRKGQPVYWGEDVE